MGIRTDWLDKMGPDMPETIDEFIDALIKAHNTFSTEYTYSMDSTAQMDFVVSALGVKGFSVGGSMMLSAVDIGQYHVDQEIKQTLQEDGYRTYLEYFHRWYQEGVIANNFYEETGMPDANRGPNNQSFVWVAMATAMVSNVNNPAGFQVYDDTVMRKLVERVTAIDSSIIRVKFYGDDVETTVRLSE